MKIGKIILLNMLFLLLLSIGVTAAEKYIIDDAKVLKQNTINTVEENLGKIEKNTDVIVKFDLVKSLNGKSIDDYSKQYAKDNIKGEQYILFVSSIGDKKNKILVGSKANNILSKSDIEKIVSLPNQDFKSNNFDAGIIKVGKALDEKVTTKAVKLGKAEVKKNGYSTNVQHKTNYFGVFGVIVLIVIISIVLFVLIKNKINNDYEKRKRKFAEENNLDSYLDSDDNSFRSANIGSKKSNTGYSYDNNSTSRVNYDTNSRTSDNSYTQRGNSSINNTTIIHNDDKFVEGMVLGSILSDSSHHHHNCHDEEYREHERSHYDSDDSSYSSGNWDSNSDDSYSTSSWDSNSSSDDSSSSSWGSDSSSSDGSSSSWDSSSDSSSSDW